MNLVHFAVFVTGISIVVGLFMYTVYCIMDTINDVTTVGEVILYVIGVLVVFASIAFYGTLWHY
jgi:hypothetical protein